MDGDEKGKANKYIRGLESMYTIIKEAQIPFLDDLVKCIYYIRYYICSKIYRKLHWIIRSIQKYLIWPYHGIYKIVAKYFPFLFFYQAEKTLSMIVKFGNNIIIEVDISKASGYIFITCIIIQLENSHWYSWYSKHVSSSNDLCSNNYVVIARSN